MVTRSQLHVVARNELALAVTMPDKLVAFPGDRGTNGCVRAAEALGVVVEDERNGNHS